MGRGLRLGTVLGIPVWLDLSWFAGLAFFALVTHGLWGPQVRGGAALALSVAFTCAFFGSLLVHELCHALAARVLGVPTAEITLFVFGGAARILSEPPDAGGEALMAMAGPLASVGIAGTLALLAQLPPSGWPRDLLTDLSLANLVLAVFNLLPGFPLDGGRVLRALLWRLSGRRLAATRLVAWFGRALGALLALGGLVATVRFAAPRYLLNLVLGLFLVRAAGEGERTARHADQLAGRSVADFMAPAPASAPGWATLADLAARGLLAPGRGALVVVSGDGRPLGRLPDRLVAGVPAAQWPSTTAASVAEPVGPGELVGAAQPACEFLHRYRAAPAEAYLVVDAKGRLAGVVDEPALRRLSGWPQRPCADPT